MVFVVFVHAEFIRTLRNQGMGTEKTNVLLCSDLGFKKKKTTKKEREKYCGQRKQTAIFILFQGTQTFTLKGVR